MLPEGGGDDRLELVADGAGGQADRDGMTLPQVRGERPPLGELRAALRTGEGVLAVDVTREVSLQLGRRELECTSFSWANGLVGALISLVRWGSKDLNRLLSPLMSLFLLFCRPAIDHMSRQYLPSGEDRHAVPAGQQLLRMDLLVLFLPDPDQEAAVPDDVAPRRDARRQGH